MTAEDLRCAEAIGQMDLYLDRALADNQRCVVTLHLDACDECTRRFSFEGQVLDGLRKKLQRIEVPESLRARVFHVGFSWGN